MKNKGVKENEKAKWALINGSMYQSKQMKTMWYSKISDKFHQRRRVKGA